MKMKSILAVVGTIALGLPAGQAGANAQPVVKAAATAISTNKFVYKHELRKTPATRQPSFTITAAPGFRPETTVQSQKIPAVAQAPRIWTPEGPKVFTAKPMPPTTPRPTPTVGATGYTGQRKFRGFLGGLIQVDVTPPPPLPRVTTQSQNPSVFIRPGYVYTPHENRGRGARGQSISVRPGKGGGQQLSGTIKWR